MRERPKSREETPKEGDGSARINHGYRTATTYTATHKKQVLLTYLTVIFPRYYLRFVQGWSSQRHEMSSAVGERSTEKHSCRQCVSAQSACGRVPLRKIKAMTAQYFDGNLVPRRVQPATHELPCS